jgi:hypothetical protein
VKRWRAKVLLVIEHNAQYYVGTLSFDDSVFCSQICALLQLHLSQSIKQIGDLDVSFTPVANADKKLPRVRRTDERKKA